MKWAATVTLLYVNILCCSPLWIRLLPGATSFDVIACYISAAFTASCCFQWKPFENVSRFLILLVIFGQHLIFFFPVWCRLFISMGFLLQTVSLLSIVSIFGPLINPFSSYKSVSPDSPALSFCSPLPSSLLPARHWTDPFASSCILNANTFWHVCSPSLYH